LSSTVENNELDENWATRKAEEELKTFLISVPIPILLIKQLCGSHR